jgi:hypothetical protein
VVWIGSVDASCDVFGGSVGVVCRSKRGIYADSVGTHMCTKVSIWVVRGLCGVPVLSVISLCGVVFSYYA